MATSLKEVSGYLHDLGVDVAEDDINEIDEMLHYSFDAHLTRFKVYMHVEHHGRLLQCYAYPRPNNTEILSEPIRQQLLERVNEFNTEIRYGRWTIDEEGDSRVHFSFILEDAPLSRRQLARIHFLLSDLVVHQAHALQIESQTGMPCSGNLIGLSAISLMAAHHHPSLVESIAASIKASSSQAKVLYAMAGVPYVNNGDDEDDDETSSEGQSDFGMQLKPPLLN